MKTKQERESDVDNDVEEESKGRVSALSVNHEESYDDSLADILKTPYSKYRYRHGMCPDRWEFGIPALAAPNSPFVSVPGS
jgi:hypothetical protein